MTTRRSQVVVLGMTAVLAGAITGCSSGTRPTSAGVCVDPDTNTRVEDRYCDQCLDPRTGKPLRKPNGQPYTEAECEAQHRRGGGGVLLLGGLRGPGYYYYNNGARVPRVGGAVSGGSFSAPSNHSYVRGGVDRNGTTLDASKVKGGKTTTISRGGFGGSGSNGSS